MKSHTNFDWDRKTRTGLPEVVFAEGKSINQVRDIIDAHVRRDASLLLTRLTTSQMLDLESSAVEINRDACTATLAARIPCRSAPCIGMVSAGTSDLRVASEVCEVASFFGLNTKLFLDLGVSGLWRLQDNIGEIAEFPLIVAVAGMEGALFSVLAGLVSAPVIAVPTSVGYGVAKGGHAALSSALASCAPGIVTVNIDNGFGAAAAAYKILCAQRLKALTPDLIA